MTGRSKIDTTTQTHDHPLSWFGTGTTIKSGGVKLALWPQTCHHVGMQVIITRE